MVRGSRSINVVQAYAEGEIGWVVTSGIMNLLGENIVEKRKYLINQRDDLRQFLLYEPRGSVHTSVNLLLPPTDPEEADIGLITIETVDYPPISGSNTICAVTVALETGILEMMEPVTKVRIESPVGILQAVAHCRDGKCERVAVEGIECFVFDSDVALTLPNGLTISVDIVFSGAFFLVVKAEDVDVELCSESVLRIVEIGKDILMAGRRKLRVQHPIVPHYDTVGFVLFTTPFKADEETVKGAVVIPPGRLDRSPCGTGTMSRLMTLFAKGQLGVGDALIQESILGTRFKARVLQQTDVGGYPGIIASIEGRAWITGHSVFTLDPADPFPHGFEPPNLWGRAKEMLS
ncbi:MAG: proline racemase family protein [Anaerolineales bacterium]